MPGHFSFKSCRLGPTDDPQPGDLLKDHQNSDGGWSFAVGGDSDADDTAATISALLAAGEAADSTAIAGAISYLKSQQQSNGGFISEGVTNSGVDAW